MILLIITLIACVAAIACCFLSLNAKTKRLHREVWRTLNCVRFLVKCYHREDHHAHGHRRSCERRLDALEGSSLVTSTLCTRETVEDNARRARELGHGVHRLALQLEDMHTSVIKLRELSADSPSEFTCGHCPKTMTQGEVRGMCCDVDSRPAYLICNACLRKWDEEQKAEAEEAEKWGVDEHYEVEGRRYGKLVHPDDDKPRSDTGKTRRAQERKDHRNFIR